MSSRPRIVIVGAAPWLAQGLASALVDEARWELVVRPAIEPAEAYVLHARDEGEAADLQAALPPLAPVLWVGATPAAGAPATTAGTATPAGDEVELGRAVGQLPSDAGAEQLRAALAAVLAGLSVRGAAASWPARAETATSSARRVAFAETAEALTSRELEVFELLAKGLSNRDVAGVLGISAHTAKFHVAQILAKVGAATRAEAVAIGLRLGLIGL